MKLLALFAFSAALAILACSSSSDPTPSGGDDAGAADSSFVIEGGGGACGATGAACGDDIMGAVPCCSGKCVIGMLGDMTCE